MDTITKKIYRFLLFALLVSSISFWYLTKSKNSFSKPLDNNTRLTDESVVFQWIRLDTFKFRISQLCHLRSAKVESFKVLNSKFEISLLGVNSLFIWGTADLPKRLTSKDKFMVVYDPKIIKVSLSLPIKNIDTIQYVSVPVDILFQLRKI